MHQIKDNRFGEAVSSGQKAFSVAKKTLKKTIEKFQPESVSQNIPRHSMMYDAGNTYSIFLWEWNIQFLVSLRASKRQQFDPTLEGCNPVTTFH